MTAKQCPPPVPDGMTGSGRQLWSSVVDDFDLDEHELAILREACRTATAIDALQSRVDRDGVLNESPQGLRVHPGLVELRQQRLAFTKLIAALAIPADDTAPGNRKPRARLRAVK